MDFPTDLMLLLMRYTLANPMVRCSIYPWSGGKRPSRRTEVWVDVASAPSSSELARL